MSQLAFQAHGPSGGAFASYHMQDPGVTAANLHGRLVDPSQDRRVAQFFQEALQSAAESFPNHDKIFVYSPIRRACVTDIRVEEEKKINNSRNSYSLHAPVRNVERTTHSDISRTLVNQTEKESGWGICPSWDTLSRNLDLVPDLLMIISNLFLV